MKDLLNYGERSNDKANYKAKKARKKKASSRRKRSNKKLRIALITVAVILLVTLATAVVGVLMLLGKINYLSDDDMIVPSNVADIVLSDTDMVSEADTFTAAEMELFNNSIKDNFIEKDKRLSKEGVTNVLLLGTDGRSHSKNKTRSDAMVLMSINENTRKIVLTSVMRDTYVHIPGRPENEKITHAHAYGGPALAMETVEGALGVNIDHFAEVNFISFAELVDVFGGVDIDITRTERGVINNYVNKMFALYMFDDYHKSGTDYTLYSTGENTHLNGIQALAYTRIRDTGNGDYQRTERQRIVLEQLIDKARKSDYKTLVSGFDTVADDVTTDYSMAEIMALAMKVGEYKDYEIVQLRIPDDRTDFISGIYRGYWVLRIDFEASRKLLYSEIFE